jgi:hypothetical protein
VRDLRSWLISNLDAQRMPTWEGPTFFRAAARIKANCIFSANSLCDLSERIHHGVSLVQKIELSANAPH